MKKIACAAILLCTYTSYAQGIKINKSIPSRNFEAPKLTSFKFKGKLLTTTSKSSGNNAVPAERRTVRDGVTKEVVPYDGSRTGAKETESPQTSNTSGNTLCTNQNVTLTAGFNELNLLDPNGIEIWPGRVVKISSMDDGSYTDFTGFTSRKDMNLAMIAAGSAQTSVVRTIGSNNISQGRVIDAINNMKNSFGRNDFGSDTWMFESFNFYNSNQLLIEAGAGVNATPIQLEIRASAGFNSQVKKNKIVLKFVREAYDVKVDTDLDEIVTANNLSNDAGIIASVTYGQLGIIEIESDSSLTDMSAALDFAFNVDPSVNISGNLRTQLNNTIASFSIKGIFKGVQGNATIPATFTINDLKRILLGDGDITATTPVVPLSFVVKSLSDGSTMMLKSTMSYNKRECTVLPPSGTTKLAIKFLALTVPKVNDGFSDDEDIFGKISVRTNFDRYNDFIPVWQKSKRNNVKVKQSSTPRDPGAYDLVGDARDYEFKFENNDPLLPSKKLFVHVDLEDDEAFKVTYDEKILQISITDLLQSINASGTTTLDNFSADQRAFYVDVVEHGNTNKVRVWFKVKKIS